MRHRLFAMVGIIPLALLAAGWSPVGGQEIELAELVDLYANEVEQQVIAWRRDIHEHPELGNREFRTAALVAEHLRSLGFEVQTGVAHTGVVGVLRGAKPGTVVALRADMDAHAPPRTGAEDFSFFAEEVPGLYIALGVAPPDDPSKRAPNHSPLFFADERALKIGVRALASLAVDYLLQHR